MLVEAKMLVKLVSELMVTRLLVVVRLISVMLGPAVS